MLPEYTLVVVDVQPQFVPDGSPVLGPLLREIESAKRRQCPIVIIETPWFGDWNCEDYGPVLEPIKIAVKGYEHLVRLQKDVRYEYSAASYLLKAFPAPSAHFRITGAHTGCWLRDEDDLVKEDASGPFYIGCVFDLVVGLRRLNPSSKIDVVADACHEGRKWVNVRWSDFDSFEGLRVL